jgi:hypothetical protein
MRVCSSQSRTRPPSCTSLPMWTSRRCDGSRRKVSGNFSLTSVAGPLKRSLAPSPALRFACIRSDAAGDGEGVMLPAFPACTAALGGLGALHAQQLMLFAAARSYTRRGCTHRGTASRATPGACSRARHPRSQVPSASVAGFESACTPQAVSSLPQCTCRLVSISPPYPPSPLFPSPRPLPLPPRAPQSHPHGPHPCGSRTAGELMLALDGRLCGGAPLPSAHAAVAFFVGRFWYLLVAPQLLLAPWSVGEHAGHAAEVKQTPRLLPACAYRRGGRGRARGPGGAGEPVSCTLSWLIRYCPYRHATAYTGTGMGSSEMRCGNCPAFYACLTRPVGGDGRAQMPTPFRGQAVRR